jgi:hypothetical protein
MDDVVNQNGKKSVAEQDISILVFFYLIKILICPDYFSSLALLDKEKGYMWFIES